MTRLPISWIFTSIRLIPAKSMSLLMVMIGVKEEPSRSRSWLNSLSCKREAAFNSWICCSSRALAWAFLVLMISNALDRAFTRSILVMGFTR